MEDPQDDEKGTDTTSRSTGPGKGSSGRSRRRPRSQEGRAGRDLNDDTNDGIKRRKSGGDNAEEEDEGLCLACPYYKLDRFKHHDCLKYRLKRIKDVKQHLSRVHKQAHYCPSCGLEFDTQTEQMEHSRVQQCRIRELIVPEGISQDQRDALSSRVPRKLPIGEQWFVVWDIVFPERKRPESPYVETQINEMLSNFREFWQERGPEIVTGHLRSHRELSYSLANEERSLASVHASTMHAAMGVLIDRFLESYAASTSLAREASDNGSESVSGNPSAETTSTDEGVADVRSAPDDVAGSQVSSNCALPPRDLFVEDDRTFALRGQLVPPAGMYDGMAFPEDQQGWQDTGGFDVVGAWAADTTIPIGFFLGDDLI
ncbi:hypothetical protein CPLU01_00619 [Colletotrichum plurivorum]|uniref:C2H2-type domain-containing protein n=1 Tax=Colletotrichum plurivorum TaxID=2175906 RepID=A0A8H6NS67_9PEZI|nr:hypothetical protein CPLU01_00619 [Colletotrichum plurivorum]